MSDYIPASDLTDRIRPGDVIEIGSADGSLRQVEVVKVSKDGSLITIRPVPWYRKTWWWICRQLERLGAPIGRLYDRAISWRRRL